MPEDAHPGLPRKSEENYHYFTLSMALNYQRDSYSLWRAATETYRDARTSMVFRPSEAVMMNEWELRDHLTKYRLALQPTRHTHIWRLLCQTIVDLFHGDIRLLFRSLEGDIRRIKEFVQQTHKSRFPYISGPKICNYWLYVIGQYTDARLVNREALTVAPDTHVIQASIRIGLIDPSVRDSPHIQSIVSDAWSEVLAGTGIAPIDIHTPLWLWSRGGFIPIS